MLENFRSQKIIWDRANKTIFEKIEANSGDSNGRKLVVQVINQGVTENLIGTTLSLGWKYRESAKGLDAFNVVDASKGIFEIYYTTEMLSNIGNIEASLVLTDSTGRIESSTFTISVTPSTVDDSSVQSENSFTALTEALVKVNDLEGNYAPRLNEVTAQLEQNTTDITNNLENLSGRRSILDWQHLVIDDGLETEDWKDAFQAARDFLKNSTVIQELVFPARIYKYSQSPNWAINDILLKGEGKVLFEYTGLGTAFLLDAFEMGTVNDPFIKNCNLENLFVFGESAKSVIHARGIARSSWKKLHANGTDGSIDTTGYLLESVMLSSFSDVYSSYVDGVVPHTGFKLKSGTRGSVNAGACSNNFFTGIYPEGNIFGLHLTKDGADQNVFISGAPERCIEYGQIVGQNCRYNTFIGMGYENANVLNADIDDNGEYSRYINCYSNEKTFIKGKGIKISGAYFELLEVTTTAINTSIEDVTVNNWETTTGGFINRGEGTHINNVFNKDTQKYIYINKARYTVTPTQSPFEWYNTEQLPVKVRLTEGTVTQILIYRDNDFWEEPKPSEGNAFTQGIYLLSPGDKIRVSYSAIPKMNVIPLNNI